MNKKGFTLIELLAVLVILAIIALITIPIVLKTISNSEVQAEKQSIDGYARVIEEDKANEEMLHPGKQYQIKSSEEYEYKGNKVFCENKYFDENEKLVLENCYVSDKEITDPDQKAKKNHYNYINGKVEPIPKSNNNNEQGNNSESSSDTSNNNQNDNNYNTVQNYKVGDKIQVKEDYYYVIAKSNENQDYVTALKENPLTATEINSNKMGSDGLNHVNRYTSESRGEAFSNEQSYGRMAYYSSSTCGYPSLGGSVVKSGCESEGATNYSHSDIRYVVDNWVLSKFSENDLKKVDGYKARLIKIEELKEEFYILCDTINPSYCTLESTTPSWLYEPNKYAYWTMSQWENSNSAVWNVIGNGSLDGRAVYSYSLAVRPVINVYKSKIGS